MWKTLGKRLVKGAKAEIIETLQASENQETPEKDDSGGNGGWLIAGGLGLILLFAVCRRPQPTPTIQIFIGGK